MEPALPLSRVRLRPFVDDRQGRWPPIGVSVSVPFPLKSERGIKGFRPFAMLIEGEERLILKEADIFGVIEGKMWAASMRRLYDLANLIIKRAIEIAGNGAVVRTRAARRSATND
jgi:hypothetical protein